MDKEPESTSASPGATPPACSFCARPDDGLMPTMAGGFDGGATICLACAGMFHAEATSGEDAVAFAGLTLPEIMEARRQGPRMLEILMGWQCCEDTLCAPAGSFRHKLRAATELRELFESARAVVARVLDGGDGAMSRIAASVGAHEAALRAGLKPTVVPTGITDGEMGELLSRDSPAGYDVTGLDDATARRFDTALSDRNLAREAKG